MRRVIVHGFFDEPRVFNFVAATALDVVEWLGRMVPEMGPDLYTGPKRIEVVGYRTVEELVGPLRDGEDIIIVPQYNGNKKGLGQILLGGLLIALSIVGAPFLGPMVAGLLMKVGALLILGGLSQLLNPTPKMDSDNGNEKARYLGPPKNTVASGTRIPILCGYHRTGGHILSYDINGISVRPSKE